MLADGEFDKQVGNDGVDVWVTQMGDYMNMNTAFIDRKNGIVAIVDPFDSERWIEGLAEEGLRPTHILYTHTHRDHVEGYSSMVSLVPNVEVWGHEEARVSRTTSNQVFSLLGHAVFKNVDFTNTWKNDPDSSVEDAVLQLQIRALEKEADAITKKATDKTSAQNKLKALGLTDAEIEAL